MGARALSVCTRLMGVNKGGEKVRECESGMRGFHLKAYCGDEDVRLKM